ncbi:MAG: hypothetical protein DRQ39_07830 [Gammaproteobacteria bacterium]|nr:MAG: hypothetical protein DRQ39_07830 [Gammaproteobacteria bacterium]RKZ93852.1 MAG: hypothetical protein DRQ40_07055 [Gammaproteobacteria bacterium]
MDLYSIDKLMHETRQLAAKYHQTTGNTLPVTGEIARFDVAKALNLKLIDDQTLGYDALGEVEGEEVRILIKGRVIFESSRSSARIGQVKTDGRWDDVVLVLFNDNYEPIEMYLASSDDIEDAMGAKPESKSKKRGAMSVAQFKIIGQLVWSQETGLEPEIWDNHRN